jgi:hypothetical protein
MPAAIAAMMLRAIASDGALPYFAAYLDFTSSMTDLVCARLSAAAASAVAAEARGARGARGFAFFLTAFFLATIFMCLSPVFFSRDDHGHHGLTNRYRHRNRGVLIPAWHF